MEKGHCVPLSKASLLKLAADVLKYMKYVHSYEVKPFLMEEANNEENIKTRYKKYANKNNLQFKTRFNLTAEEQATYQ